MGDMPVDLKGEGAMRVPQCMETCMRAMGGGHRKARGTSVEGVSDAPTTSKPLFGQFPVASSSSSGAGSCTNNVASPSHPAREGHPAHASDQGDDDARAAGGPAAAARELDGAPALASALPSAPAPRLARRRSSPLPLFAFNVSPATATTSTCGPPNSASSLTASPSTASTQSPSSVGRSPASAAHSSLGQEHRPPRCPASEPRAQGHCDATTTEDHQEESTQTEDTMNMSATRRVQTRKQRRPSPLDIPAAKRRSPSGSTSKSLSLSASASTSKAKAAKLDEAGHSDEPQELVLPSTSGTYLQSQSPSGATDLTFRTTASTSTTFPLSPASSALFCDQSHNGDAVASTSRRQRAESPASSVDLRSTTGVEDLDHADPSQKSCACFDTAEVRTARVRVPVRLPRPDSVKSLDMDSLVLHEALSGVPIQYIADSIASQGPLLLSAVTGSLVGLPVTQNEAGKLEDAQSSLPDRIINGRRIPHTVAVRTPAAITSETSALPEYALAITSDESSQVLLLPAHGLVLAFNCTSFAELSRPPAREAPEYRAEPIARGGRAANAANDDEAAAEDDFDTVRMLPVVHIHVPSAMAFSKLMPFFYTHEKSSLLSELLPLHLMPGASTLSSAAVERTVALLAGHLARLDQSILVRYIHVNHAMWTTSVATGAAGDDLWSTMGLAWNALIGAMSVQAASARA